MKKIFILSAVLALFSACNSNKDEWKLVWADEFDGETIDEGSWTRVPTGKDDWDDMMSLRDDLAYIENGELVLMGKVNDGTAPDNGRPFVTAGFVLCYTDAVTGGRNGPVPGEKGKLWNEPRSFPI